ncbi:MAG TPA: alanine--tRNA ligase [Nitrospirales bacterium]|nr:alanine--tRNA ligase [Nitrospirales bacterium]
MTSAELRAQFLSYFSERNHTIVPSASLIPQADPSLLFINAGMVPFKSVFLGEETRGYSRAVSSQRCIRAGGKHNDLEQVGLTGRHHTFFEMLGNFSFGDYFKSDAIAYGWEFLTQQVGLPKDKLLVTVFRDDDDAYDIWHRKIGLDPSRISRLDEKDNFWKMADTGPCGPCSEIYLDQGPTVSCGKPTCAVGCSCDRFLEIWNLVFMQYNRDATGALHPLPAPSIDTGMGLERLAAVSQGTSNNYTTDVFRDVLVAIGERASVTFGNNLQTDRSMQVIADHLRAIAFLITDGILPSNEGRGYVLRRILRRAARHGKLLGIQEPFLHAIIPTVVQSMGEPYPELHSSSAIIVKTTQVEEERFITTLAEGLRMLDQIIASVTTTGDTVIPGETIFKLYDTYGFPLDLIADVATDNNLTVDEVGFHAHLDTQRQRARDAGGFGKTAVNPVYKEVEKSLRVEGILFGPLKPTDYDTLEKEAEIIAIIRDEVKVSEGKAGESIEIMLNPTPFYAEGGGQVGDRGVIRGPEGIVEITKTLQPIHELASHQGHVLEGRVRGGDIVQAIVDRTARFDTMRNHTATHLLHAALREILGTHAKQLGSLVAPDRLRFDFSHMAPLTNSERDDVERLVNEWIRENIAVHPQEMSKDEALAHGALAFFGDKYGEKVRMVEIGDASKELCGGTHCHRTGDIGAFRLINETGIAAGVRRIEAVTGQGADDYAKARDNELRELASILKTTPADLLSKAKKTIGLVKEKEELVETLRQRLSSSQTQSDSARVRTIGTVQVCSQSVGKATPEDLRTLSDSHLARMKSGIIALASTDDGNVALLVRVSKDLVPNFHAGNLVKALAPAIDGRGGGKPEMGQAGGKNADKLDWVLDEELDRLIRDAVGARTSTASS